MHDTVLIETADDASIDWRQVTLGSALNSSASLYPDRIAIVDGDRRMSYAELDKAARDLAHGLQSLGIGRRQQVAIWMTNSIDWVVSWMACAHVGAVVVPINTRYKADEVEYILRQSDAVALIMMDRYWGIDFVGMVNQVVPELAASVPGKLQCKKLPALKSVLLWKDVQVPGTRDLQTLTTLGAEFHQTGARLSPQHPGDAVIIVYTSGTTGHPKGAVHSHIVLQNASNIARVMHIEPGDVVMGHMPFYHVAGAITAAALSILKGCTLVSMPQWDPDHALDLIERERVSIFGGIPTHFIDCIDAVRKRPRDTSCLKSAWIGGAPVTPDVALSAKRELGLLALQVVYGMTETTGSTTFSEFDADLEVVCSNKGRPIGDFEVKTVDPQTHRPIDEPGIQGEVWVRGHLVMMGYYKNDKATAEVITPDGWFRTGDLGTFDDEGYLMITGRLKEMFIVGGSNAYPAEIERMILSHDSIKQVVVVGVPDARLGEVGFAFVQPKSDAVPNLEELAAELKRFCRSQMADYKVPRTFNVVNEFPRTPTGKIQRFALATMARELVSKAQTAS
ncbi:class I adenylate-forming enzyme family protein [Variovorax sp. VNK109]|uniref:class I adenylate-forming enzyme family protein n=1 Tax=Variovorax sp. VNK109 TaxID=3400919 RepID=UPI003C03E373